MHNDLTASEILAMIRAKEKADADKAIARLKAMMADFQANNLFAEIEFTFSGAGGQGEIDEPYAMNEKMWEFVAKTNYVFDYSDLHNEENDGKVYVLDLLTKVLTGCESDWDIDQGSSGSIYLNFENDGERKVNVLMIVNQPVEKDFEF